MRKTNNGPWLTIWCCDTKSAREICREGWKLSSALAVGAPLKCAVLFPEDGLLILVTGAAADARIDNTARGHPVSALHWVQKREANLNLNLLPPLAACLPPCLCLTLCFLPHCQSLCAARCSSRGKKDLPVVSLRQRFLPGVFVFRAIFAFKANFSRAWWHVSAGWQMGYADRRKQEKVQVLSQCWQHEPTSSRQR